MAETSYRNATKRSETFQQHQYEARIHEEQLGAIDDVSGKNGKVEGVPGSDDKKAGFFRRLKDQIKSSFPEAVQDIKVLRGMTGLEGSVKRDIKDPSIYPEVDKIAQVRRGLDLCDEESSFLEKRSYRVRKSFAQYLELDEEDINLEDIPTISLGGSGGGFRAMIACLAYGEAMKEAGLWDCLTYVAGVSGSCWSLAAFYTFGNASMTNVIEHCKSRLSPYHPLSGDAIRRILSTPGGPHATLGPLIQKSVSGLQTVAMDLYSVFTTGWIFLQDHSTGLSHGAAKQQDADSQRSWHKFSSVREHTDTGAEPLPILTAIRHERPWKDWHDKEVPFVHPDPSEGDHAEADNAWFQWFEITPYEVGCDEIEAWVPTWAFGRPFEEGKSAMQLPEQSLALLLGLCTSAPAGPLTSYIATINRNLPRGFLGDSIHSMAHGMTRLWGQQGTQEFQNHHPLHAVNEHNFMYHFTPVSPDQGRPPGLENSPRIHLIDSGMDNNCPTYVLLHPTRRADVIINMDASSDVQKDSFPDRVNQIGNRRGLNFTKRHNIHAGEDPQDPDRFKALCAQVYDGLPIDRPETVVDSYGKTVANPPADVYPGECTMIYMPVLPNQRVVPDFDPSTAEFSGSYNLVWSPEQVDMLVRVCRANFEDGHARIKETLREVWWRKKAEREGRLEDCSKR